MKKAMLFLSIGVLSSGISFAQSSEDSSRYDFSVRNNEIGIQSIQYSLGQDMGMFTGGGLNYKRWLNNTLGLRLGVAYEEFSNSVRPRILEGISKDSIRMGYFHQEAKGFQVSVGLEAQKPLYKSIYIFGAIDLIGGYDKGNVESYSSIVNLANNSMYWPFGNSKDDYGIEPYSLTYLNLRPSFGVKAVFKRWNIGMDVSLFNLFMNSETIHQVSGNYNILNFELGTFNASRAFVNFRF